ncbi:hypothetical protein Vafri_8290 [Volvox africanus]|nr:hypothetical protein Vafri_8290 [Volvox africanus]
MSNLALAPDLAVALGLNWAVPSLDFSTATDQELRAELAKRVSTRTEEWVMNGDPWAADPCEMGLPVYRARYHLARFPEGLSLPLRPAHAGPRKQPHPEYGFPRPEEVSPGVSSHPHDEGHVQYGVLHVGRVATTVWPSAASAAADLDLAAQERDVGSAV